MSSWFVASSHYWQVHQQFLDGLPVNRALSNARWSARYEAVRAINKGYSAKAKTFEELASDNSQPYKSQIEAEGFLKKLKLLEASILLELWDAISNRFY